MQEYRFFDALTGDTVSFDYETGEAYLVTSGDACAQAAGGPAASASAAGELAAADASANESAPASASAPAPAPGSCTSLFFPGCSFVNYAIPLVGAVYDTLREADAVNGISLLCCGKILVYEPDGEAVRASFEEKLCEHVAAAGVKRIVAACPNCVAALRAAFAADERTSCVEVVPLPVVLAELGYRIDAATTALLVKGDASASVRLCTHDSCPDRERGEFADGLRALLPDDLYVDPAHCRSRSICCGSLARAAGKFGAADKCARRNGEEALEAGADALVTACLSCTFQLNMAQSSVQAVHFLELLYSWRIDWSSVGSWMKLRFLFDETLGVVAADGSGRAYQGLGGARA